MVLLGIILGGAFALRVWGLRFGLPYVYHFDEHFYVATAVKLGRGILNNPPFAPVGLANILFLEYGAYFLISRLSGWVGSAAEFEANYRFDPSFFFYLARLTSAFLGTLTVGLVYRLGNSLFGRRGGFIAAVLLATSFLHVRDSHFGVPDIPMAFFTVATTAAALAAHRSGRLRHLIVAGLLAGVAVSVKWTAAPITLVVGMAGLFQAWDQSSPRSWTTVLVSRPVWTAVAATIAGFILSAPQVVINPLPYFIEAFDQAASGGAGGFNWWQVDTVSGWIFYLKVLYQGLGAAVWAAGLAGFLIFSYRMIRERDRARFLVLLFPLSYYLIMGITRHYFARYSLPLIPFWMLFVTEGFALIFPIFPGRSARHSGEKIRLSLPAALILIALIGQPLASALRTNWLLTREDTRTQAKAWIEANIPERSRIAISWETHVPPLSSLRNPDPRSTRIYDVSAVRDIGLPRWPLDWYRRHGYDYFIVSSFIENIQVIDPVVARVRAAFYQNLARELVLVAEFAPARQPLPFVFDEIYGPFVSHWQRERPGPRLKIYRFEYEADP